MSKYDEERKKILEGMQSSNVSFTSPSTSKYASERSTGKSKYDDEREALYNPKDSKLVAGAKSISKVGGLVQDFVSNPKVQSVVGAIDNAAKIQNEQRTQAMVQQGMPSGVDMVKQFDADHPTTKSKGLAAAMASGLGNLADHATFGLTKPLTSRFENYISNENSATKVAPGQLDPKKQQIADLATGLVGDIGSGAGAWKAGKLITNPLTKRLPGLVEKGVGAIASRLSPTAGALTRVGAQQVGKGLGMSGTGYAGMALWQAGQEGTGALYHDNNKTLRDSLGDIHKSGMLGAIGDPFLETYLGALGPLFSKLFKRNGIPEAQTQEILALPLGREDAARAARAPQPGIDPIVTPYTFGLPEPQVGAATTGRMAQQTNPYRQQFENLMQTAQKLQAEGKFTPGREEEELTSLWSQMAGRDAPSLDELINLAYKPRPNRLTPDLVQRAQSTQQAREVAGAPLPVRSMSDRYPQGAMGEASPITQKIGRAPGKSEVLPVNAQDRPRLDVTPVSESPQNARLGSLSARRLNPDSPPALVRDFPQETKTPEEIKLMDDAPPADKMKQNWFTNLFGNNGVGISAFGSSRAISRDPLTTADQIVNKPLKNSIQGTKAQAQQTARAAYQNFVDDLDPLKRISKRTYDKALDSRRANNIANTIVEDKFVNPQGEVLGDSLKDVFGKVGRGQTKSFLDYLVLRHAKTRISRGEEVYSRNLDMNANKVQKRLDMYDGRHPEFQNIAKEWDKFNENMIKVYGVDEGLMSPEMFNILRDKNPNYTPMNRQFTTAEKFASSMQYGAKPAFSGQKAPIKEVSPNGSVRRIVDPRRSTIEAAGAWVNAAMRNRVMTSIVDKIKSDPAGFKGIAEIIQPPKGQKNLKDILKEDGQEGFLESLNGDFNQLFNRSRLDQDNVVRAMVKGEPVYIRIHDPEAVKALVGLGPEKSNLIMSMFDMLSKATKRSATGILSPGFAIKSLSMDATQSVMQADKPLQQFGNLFHALFSSLADQLPKNTPFVKGLRSLAEDYRRSGGHYSASLREDSALKRSVGKLDRNPILSTQNVAKGAVKTVAAPFKVLGKLADISENTPRMAAFKGELKNRGGERTPDNITAAIRASQEATTNFSRRGSMSRTLEKGIPYNNAAIQGSRRFLLNWKNHPVKTLAAVVTAVMLPKLYEYSQFHDDPDYQKLSSREKYRNLIINKREDGTFDKIPMPMEYNPIGALMVDGLEYFMDNDPEAFKGAADAVREMYLPPSLEGVTRPTTQGGGAKGVVSGGLGSTVLSPAVSVIANKDYAGRPIVSQSLANNSAPFQFDENTSSVAKKIGEKINMSPKEIDYLLRQYGGDPARILLPLTSDVGKGNTRNALLRSFNVDPQYSNTLSNDFYAYKTSLTNVKNDVKKGADIPEWYSDELRKSADRVQDRLSDLSSYKKAINTDGTLSAQEKTKQTREVQGQMNELYAMMNELFRGSKVPRTR